MLFSCDLRDLNSTVVTTEVFGFNTRHSNADNLNSTVVTTEAWMSAEEAKSYGYLNSTVVTTEGSGNS